MNPTTIYNLTKKAMEAYISVYRAQHSDEPVETVLKSLRSWSFLSNGISLYINSSDLMPEFTLSDNVYASLKAFGCEININNRVIGDVVVNLTSGDKYGLVDLEALLTYVTDHMADDELEATLSDFFVENTVRVDSSVSAQSIKERASLQAKAELLEQLMSRNGISFTN